MHSFFQVILVCLQNRSGQPLVPFRSRSSMVIPTRNWWNRSRKICITSIFFGLPGFFDEAPYVPSLLVEFRKRLDNEILAQINEMIIAYNTPDDPVRVAEGSRLANQKRDDGVELTPKQTVRLSVLR